MAEHFPCELVSLERVYELSHGLAQAIRGASFIPDTIVAIARGGFVPARFLCDFLFVSNMTCIRVRHYGPGARREQRARVQSSLDADLSLQGVLLVDDVNDTGETLRVALGHLASFGPAEIRVAVLHEKQTSTVRADFRAHEVRAWRWITYPWALVEDVTGFIEQMEPRPLTLTEIRVRLERDHELRMTDTVLERILSLRTEH
jgi:hypoxanthine phosphoribosyltransferase